MIHDISVMYSRLPSSTHISKAESRHTLLSGIRFPVHHAEHGGETDERLSIPLTWIVQAARMSARSYNSGFVFRLLVHTRPSCIPLRNVSQVCRSSLSLRQYRLDWCLGHPRLFEGPVAGGGSAYGMALLVFCMLHRGDGCESECRARPWNAN